MYLWKYWRDTRTRFILILILGLIPMGRLFLIGNLGGRIPQPANMWQDLASHLWIMLVLPCALAIGFGASGPGEEFAQATQAFLFTRPRSRRYFIWTSWAMGALEIFVIVLLCVLANFLAIIHVTRIVYTWKFLLMVLPIFIMWIVAYGPVCLMSTVQRSGRKGFASGLGLIIFYILLGLLFETRWNIHLPYPSNLMLPFANLINGTTGMHASSVAAYVPVVGTVGWSLFALACPLLAQLYIERTEA